MTAPMLLLALVVAADLFTRGDAFIAPPSGALLRRSRQSSCPINAAPSDARSDTSSDDTSSSSSSPPSSSSRGYLRNELTNDHITGTGDPYISPLLDSMSRRLRRLQRLNEQNDLFADTYTTTPAAVKDDGQSSQTNVEKADRTVGGGSIINSSLAIPPSKEVVNVKAGRVHDDEQLNSIQANAPAVLLQSGPGTGKSSVLAARIAYLLQSEICRPENLVVLSFTNRDAAAIKRRALELLFPEQQLQHGDDSDNTQTSAAAGKKEMDALGAKIWSGTLHAFASGILRKYGGDGDSLRIIPAKDMKKMIRSSISRFIGSDDDTSRRRRRAITIANDNQMKMARQKFKGAMDDANQNLSALVANIVRCIELWKEAGMLPPPTLYRIHIGEDGVSSVLEESRKETIRRDCMELSVRWGIPQSAATLALDVYPDYQGAHAAAGTADPSDLAALARDLLLANPAALLALRTKLKHVILDEYQDISVSQHALLRLILRGHDEEEKFKGPRRRKSRTICYDVPRLFCAGDANQSLYGWRGAMPSLTVDRFLSDYPQGVVVPLGTNYRLPRRIMEAANLLISNKDEEPELETAYSFAISPAAETNVLKNMEQRGIRQDEFDSTKDHKMVYDKILSESGSIVSIQGLWDAREEAKFIAASIRKHSKERIGRCAKALAQLVDGRVRKSSSDEEWSLFDPTDVAIVVRSSSQLKMIQEMLTKNAIPFTVTGSASSRVPQCDDTYPFTPRMIGEKPTMHVKPVRVITMHSCKGDEFDDVYLCGWTEGVFPHPSSVSEGRIDEERRLAYVALTRARQRAVITYQSIERIAHIGPSGQRKYVTSLVRPSRFLYELMASSKVKKQARQGDKLPQKDIKWSDDYGFKYAVAGKDLPPHFVKSYQVPHGFRPERIGNEKDRKIDTINAELVHYPATGGKADTCVDAVDTAVEAGPQSSPDSTNGETVNGGEHLLGLIEHALVEMADLRIKGACKLYTKTFKDMLKDFGISRGVALVFVNNKRSDSTSVDELINASDEEVTTKALSRCTAKELGHFLAYLILSVDKVEEENTSS